MKIFNNVTELKESRLSAGQIVKTKGYYTPNDGGGAEYLIVASGTGVDDGGSYINLAVSQAKVLQESVLDIKQFGAKPSLYSFDNFLIISNYVSYIRTYQDFPILDFKGELYYGKSPLNFDFSLKVCNGIYEYNGTANNIAILSIGNFNGDSLVRGAIVDSFRVRMGLTSTNTDITGIRLQGLVRSTIIKDSVAEMFGDVQGTKNHVGFEILANRLAVSTSAGAYQNSMDNCTALFANIGFKISTAGTDEEARLDPQANGNYLTKCFAFSCRQKAIKLGFGSQENHCEIRADTFPSQLGLGTRIDVADVDGSYNTLDMVEEIGSRADTQYTIRLGSEAVYNKLQASTQQIVSGFLDDSTTTVGKREKNIVSQLGSALISKRKGGTEISHSQYSFVPASQSTLQLSRWIAPSKCVVTRIEGMLTGVAPAGGSTFLYFGKNSSFLTNNRLTWAESEAGAVKSLTTDLSAGTAIGSQWCLDEGDFISLAATTPAGGGATCVFTMFVTFV